MPNLNDLVISAPTLTEKGGAASDKEQPTPPQMAGPSLAGMVTPEQQQQGPQFPQMSHEQAVETIHHLSESERLLGKLFKTSGIGQKDIKSNIYDVAAEMLADGLLSVPQLMTELKTIPDDPPSQKTWVERHLMNAQQAKKLIISSYNPPAEMSTLGKPSMPHSAMMGDVIGMFKGIPRG